MMGFMAQQGRKVFTTMFLLVYARSILAFSRFSINNQKASQTHFNGSDLPVSHSGRMPPFLPARSAASARYAVKPTAAYRLFYS